MARQKVFKTDNRRRVALLVETSLVTGRRILDGIAQYTREFGPWSLYHEPSDLGSPPPRWLTEWHGDGIIARLHDSRIAEAVTAVGVPVVDVLGMARVASVPLVHADDAAIARLAAEHLLERSFEQYGCCAVKGSNWSQQRCDVFVRTVAAMGHPCSIHYLPEYVQNRNRSNASRERQQERLCQWVMDLPKPVGVLAVSDLPGQAVLEACRQMDIRVPEELAVVGVDNDTTICEISEPPLSSVIYNQAEIGYEAARLLDKLMQGARAPRNPIYTKPAGVAMRRSTDIVAIEDKDVIEAIRFIRQFACEGIAVSDVAEHVLMSPTTLKRHFRDSLSRSVHDQIIAERIKKVRQLLAESTMSLSDIARRTGFGSQAYMGVVFKSQTGHTPGQYRNEMRSS